MIEDLLTIDDYLHAIDLVIEQAEKNIPTEIIRVKVHEWAELNRVIPDGLSPYPRPYSFDLCPYMVEIVNALSETSPIKEIAVMKGTSGDTSFRVNTADICSTLRGSS